MKATLFACTCAALVAGVAAAQPAATDLGAIPSGTPTSAFGSIGNGEIVWYTITIPDVVAPGFLDIDSEGSLLSTSNDTEIGLYSADGTLVASDDDDGNGLLSALSFGAAFPTRPPTGSGVAFNGRDGAILTAGTYYVSISGFNTTFGATNWGATSASTNTGNYVLTLRLDEAVIPPDWYLENSDAGDLPATATVLEGNGPLSRIIGNFGSSTDPDMYLIEICDIGSFSATTTGNTTLDTQLFLFNESGNGIVHNDDQSVGTPVIRQSYIDNAVVNANGRYYLAISGYNRDPIDGGGALLWNNTPFDGQRVPDGPAAGNPVAGWTGTGVAGGYAITLTGACYVNNAPPCPGDLDGDGAVNLTDLATLLSNFGLPSGATLSQGDIDGDGDVDLTDLATLLANFGTVCA